MQERLGYPPRLSKRYSARGLAARTVLTFIAAALISAVLYSLIRSEGISEPVSLKSQIDAGFS